MKYKWRQILICSLWADFFHYFFSKKKKKRESNKISMKSLCRVRNAYSHSHLMRMSGICLIQHRKLWVFLPHTAIFSLKVLAAGLVWLKWRSLILNEGTAVSWLVCPVFLGQKFLRYFPSVFQNFVDGQKESAGKTSFYFWGCPWAALGASPSMSIYNLFLPVIFHAQQLGLCG